MTRCKAFWDKIEKIREDKDAMQEFCAKSPSMIAAIADHSRYIERHAEKWTGSNLLELDEKSAKPLRTLERQDPYKHECALELVLTEGMSPKKAVALVTDTDEFRPKLYTIWNFQERNPLYGQEGYKWGLIAGQIVENLLYYYTEPGDYVLDPMAGGGTTIDVCNAFERNCVAFDIEPFRDDIHQHNITTGPPMCELCQLVLLEPPYYNMKQKNAYGSIQEFYHFLNLAIRNSAARVKEGGYLALILCDMNNAERGAVQYPLIGPAYKMLEAAGLTYRCLIGLPLSTQQVNRFAVTRAKEDKMLLNINRQMWVFQK